MSIKTPLEPRKSGIPEEVLIPAPTKKVILFNLLFFNNSIKL